MDAVPKGDMAGMEHPFFTLSKKPDLKIREYQNGDKWIKIVPSRYGLATIYDRDILIYCISQCMAAFNDGREVSQTVRFNAYDLLKETNRQTSGESYKLLRSAFHRLRGTNIETNITQGGSEHLHIFGFVDEARAISETRDGRMREVEIKLSDWVFDAISHNNVLTLSRDYFQLRRPLERRLYELARKHCGKQSSWKIGLENLRYKSGSNSTLKEFRRLINKTISDDAKHDHMPEYSFRIDGENVVVERKQQVKPPTAAARVSLQLDPDIYEEARRHAPGWDVRHLENQWRESVMNNKVDVKDPDAHFIGFCKKRGKHPQY